MRPLRHRWAWFFGGALIGAIVLALALLPVGPEITVTFLSDKQAHALSFFVLMLWFAGLFRVTVLPWVALGLLAYGVLIEYLQSLLPYRTAEFADVVFDVGGILVGWALATAGLGNWAQTVEAKLGKTTTT